MFLIFLCSRSYLFHNESNDTPSIPAITLTTAAYLPPCSLIFPPSLSSLSGSSLNASGKHSLSASWANGIPSMINGKICSDLPPFSLMKSLISLLTHSDLAARGEHTTIKLSAIDRALYICSGRFPALNSSTSLNVFRKLEGNSFPLSVEGNL